MIYYHLYKITNLVNGKIYIGAHETDNLDDGYLGSGSYIIRSVNKYGKENFKKDYLEFFKTREELYDKEAEVVDLDFCNRKDTYNIAPGGIGSSMIVNRKPFMGPHTEETKKKIRHKARGRYHSIETRKKMSRNNFARRNPEAQKEHAKKAALKSRRIHNCHSEETKMKIAKSLKGKKQKIVICHYCRQEGGERAMKRWHFDNCPDRYKWENLTVEEQKQRFEKLKQIGWTEEVKNRKSTTK